MKVQSWSGHYYRNVEGTKPEAASSASSVPTFGGVHHALLLSGLALRPNPNQPLSPTPTEPHRSVFLSLLWKLLLGQPVTTASSASLPSPSCDFSTPRECWCQNNNHCYCFGFKLWIRPFPSISSPPKSLSARPSHDFLVKFKTSVTANSYWFTGTLRGSNRDLGILLSTNRPWRIWFGKLWCPPHTEGRHDIWNIADWIS